MTEQERTRRRAIWERMTEAERQAAEKEKQKIIDWEIERTKEIREKIIAEGRHTEGLDCNNPEYEMIIKERNRKYEELLTRLFGEVLNG